MLVGKQKFLSLQKLFYRKITQTPHKVTLEFVEPLKHTFTPFAFNMEEFVGDCKREIRTVEFRCLYTRDITPHMREKYGLSVEVNGTIYLSPLQLKQKIGSIYPDWHKINVYFSGSKQVIEKYEYLENLTEYGSYIAVQLFLKDVVKA